MSIGFWVICIVLGKSTVNQFDNSVAVGIFKGVSGYISLDQVSICEVCF